MTPTQEKKMAERRIEVPENLREVHEMAWALANGMREVYKLTDRASGMVSAINRAQQKVASGEKTYEEAFGPDSEVAYQATYLAELAAPRESL